MSVGSTVVVFAGQGAQFAGMGRDLLDRYPAEVRDASDLLGYDLRALCLEGPDEKLRLTLYAQPALYVINALAWRRRLEGGGAPPTALAGFSLGELNALQAAGAFDFLTGLRLVEERARVMSRVPGGLAAVVGLPPWQVRRALEEEARLDGLHIANFSSYSQTVLAGPEDRLSDAAPFFKSLGARHVVPLDVSAPFHTVYMREAAEAFGAFVARFAFAPLAAPVIANTTALPYGDGEVAALLGRQIASPVRWIESIEHLLRAGATEFEEMGPASEKRKVLNLIADIRRRSAFAS